MGRIKTIDKSRKNESATAKTSVGDEIELELKGKRRNAGLLWGKKGRWCQTRDELSQVDFPPDATVSPCAAPGRVNLSGQS